MLVLKRRNRRWNPLTKKTSDLDALARELSENTEGVTFEVESAEVEAFELSAETPTNDEEIKTEGVSTELFITMICICSLIGLGLGCATRSMLLKSSEDVFDLEDGEAKRLP